MNVVRIISGVVGLILAALMGALGYNAFFRKRNTPVLSVSESAIRSTASHSSIQKVPRRVAKEVILAKLGKKEAAEIALWLGMTLVIWAVPGGIPSLMHNYQIRTMEIAASSPLGEICHVCWKPAVTSNVYIEKKNGVPGASHTYFFCAEHAGQPELPLTERTRPLVFAWTVGIGTFLLVPALLLKKQIRFTMRSVPMIPAASLLAWVVLFIFRPPGA